MNNRVRAGALTIALLTITSVLVGCGSSSPAGPQVPDDQLSASATQFRHQEGSNALRAGVTNNSNRAIRVDTATFTWPGFAWPAVRVAQKVPAGETAAFDVKYGAVRCDSQPPRHTSMQVTVDRSRRTLPLTIQDPDLLLRLWRQECSLDRLSKAVSVRLKAGRPDGSRYHATILVTRRAGSEPVRIVDVGGSVIIDMLAPRRPRMLTGSSLRLPVTFRPSDRCDGHALSQSRQTFLLSAYLRVGHGPVVRQVLPLTPTVHASLQQMIDTYCHG